MAALAEANGRNDSAVAEGFEDEPETVARDVEVPSAQPARSNSLWRSRGAV